MTDKPNDSIETLVWTTAKASELLSKVILALSNETSETYSFVTQVGSFDEGSMGLLSQTSLGVSAAEQFEKHVRSFFLEIFHGRLVDLSSEEAVERAVNGIAALVNETCRSKKAERITYEIHVPNADPYLASPIGTILAYKEIE